MDLLYYQDPEGNFGDDLNEWIWDSLLPGWKDWDVDKTLIGVGTLISHDRLGKLNDKELLIIGAGAGYGEIPEMPLPDAWDVRSVRGPRTAAVLNVPREKAIIDPAAMIADLPEFQNVSKSGVPVFVPHHWSVKRHDWDNACRRIGLKYVSPCEKSVDVIRSIAAAPFVVAESMHAAIIADSFRVPWIPVRISHTFKVFKWQDWAESLGMKLEIPPLFPGLENLYDRVVIRGAERYQRYLIRLLEAPLVASKLQSACRLQPRLSDESILNARKRQYQAVLDQVIADHV